jgi:D-sedoheptulose 7-phosphate isomerase
MKELIKKAFETHIATADATSKALGDEIKQIAHHLIECFEKNHKILLCGNGGSAADAQHLAAEMTGRYLAKNRRALPAIALTTDTSALTALGNDFGFQEIFSRQVRALGQKGDVLIGISTSGNSENVIKAFQIAHELGMTSVLLSGNDGGKLKLYADYNLIVPSGETPRIQELHITIGHILCELIDNHFAEK